MPPIDDVKVKVATKDVEKAYESWFTNYFKLFAKRALEWMLIYMVGYYDISFGWLMAPLFFLVLREKRAKEKKIKFDLVRSLANAEERGIIHEIQRFSNLPSWVTFPDMERVEWLNKTLRQLWPYAGQYAKDLCKESIEPAIRDALKEYKISGFKFDKIILGDTPPRFSGIKVYDDTSRHEIIMDADLVYAGDCKFEVGISKFKAGIKDLQISGRVRVVMKPLVRQMPLVGGLQVFFLNNPEVDFNLIGIADFFDMPGISDILRGIVIEQIAAMMVLPNRYPIQLVENIDVVQLKCPEPAGVIRLNVIEAKNLMKKDIGVLGMGKSDPYCILRLGAQKFQTKTINNTVTPRWDFYCEYLAEETSGQEVFFEIFDLDNGPNKDEFLGRANLDVQSIYASGEVDMWVPLSEAKSGRLHVKATWLDLSEISGDLEMQLTEIRALQNLTKNPLHSAALLVWVDSASKLSGIPDPFVRVHVANSQEETSVRYRTNDPVFEEGFTFLVRNPKTQELIVEVIDQKGSNSQPLGRLELDLNVLLLKKGMETISEEFSLTGAAGGLATIKLNVTLRVLKPASKREADTSVTEEVPLEESPKPGPPCEKSDTPQASESKEAGKLTTSGDCTEKESITVPKSSAEVSPSASANAPSATSDSASLRQRNVHSDGAHGLGRIQLTMKCGPRNNLVVVVHKIEKLPKEEDGEIPDPYVKMYLLPDRSRDSKRKTDVIKDSCDPVYDERFEYNVAPNELASRTLLVSVVNKKGIFKLQRSAVMGQVQLDCGALDPNNVTQWYNLTPALDEDED